MEASGCIMGCQPIIISVVIFNKLTWADVKHPLMNFWGVKSRLDSPLEIFLNPTKVCCPSRPTLIKVLPLHSWRPLDYESHTHGVHSIVKLNTTCDKKKSTFYIKGHQNRSNVFHFFSWVDIHSMYYIVKNCNQILMILFLYKTYHF
jgi:hypothetical protein